MLPRGELEAVLLSSGAGTDERRGLVLEREEDLEERGGGVEGFSTFRDERDGRCRGRSFGSFLGVSRSRSRSLSRVLARGMLMVEAVQEYWV